MRPSLRPLALCAGLCLAGAALAQQPPSPPRATPPAAPLAPVPGPAGAPGLPAAPGVRPAPPVVQPLAPPDTVQEGPAPTVSGRLQRWLVNPGGQVDGLLLADGTQVQLPPHLSPAVVAAARPGDTVQISGWRAPHVPVLRALRLTAGGRTIEDTPPVPGSEPPPPPEPAALAAMRASGRVARLLYTPRGDAHGVLLDSGTIVRFPPHVGTAMAASLQPGSSLFARGWGSRSPQGDALEATALGPSADTARELFAGPGVEPPLPGPRAARGAHGPAAHRAHRAASAGPAGTAGGAPAAVPAPPVGVPPGPLATPVPAAPLAPPAPPLS